jgi:hypothetical protein
VKTRVQLKTGAGVKHHLTYSPTTIGGGRGLVTGFSRASRKRFIEQLVRLDADRVKGALVITLTYGQSYPDPREAKYHEQLFWKRLLYAFPEASAFWRLEFQKRHNVGRLYPAPHFHLVVFGVPYIDKAIIKRIWGGVIGEKYWDHSKSPIEEPITQIDRMKNTRQLFGYVSKYIAKPDDLNVGFIHSAY